MTKRWVLAALGALVALLVAGWLLWLPAAAAPGPPVSPTPSAEAVLSVSEVADALGIQAYDPCPCFEQEFLGAQKTPDRAWDRLRAAIDCALARQASECQQEAGEALAARDFYAVHAKYVQAVSVARPSAVPEALHVLALGALDEAGQATVALVSPSRPPGLWSVARFNHSLQAVYQLQHAAVLRQQLWKVASPSSQPALLRRWELLQAELLAAAATSSGAGALVPLSTIGSTSEQPQAGADSAPNHVATSGTPGCSPRAASVVSVLQRLLQYKRGRGTVQSTKSGAAAAPVWTPQLLPSLAGLMVVVEPTWMNSAAPAATLHDALQAELLAAVPGQVIALRLNGSTTVSGGRAAQERGHAVALLTALCAAAPAAALCDSAASEPGTAAAAVAAAGAAFDALYAAVAASEAPGSSLMMLSMHGASRAALQAVAGAYAASARRLPLLLAGLSDGAGFGAFAFDPHTTACGSPVVSASVSQARLWDPSVLDEATVRGRALPYCLAAAARLHAVAAAAAAASGSRRTNGTAVGPSTSAAFAAEALPPALAPCALAPEAFTACQGTWRPAGNATGSASDATAGAHTLPVTVLQPAAVAAEAAVAALASNGGGQTQTPLSQLPASAEALASASALPALQFCHHGDTRCLRALVQAWRLCARDAVGDAWRLCWGELASALGAASQAATSSVSGLPLSIPSMPSSLAGQGSYSSVLSSSSVYARPPGAALLSRIVASVASAAVPPPVLAELDPHHRIVLAALSAFPAGSPVPAYLIPALLHRTGARQRLCVEAHPSCLGATLQRLVAAQLVTPVLEATEAQFVYQQQAQPHGRATQAIYLSPHQHAAAVAVRGQLSGALRNPRATPVLLSNLHSYIMGDASVVVAAVRDSSVQLLVRLLASSCQAVDALAAAEAGTNATAGSGSSDADAVSPKPLQQSECRRLLDGLGRATPLRLVQASPNVPPLMLGTAASVLLHVATSFAGALESAGYAEAGERLQDALRGLHADLSSADVAAVGSGTDAWEAAKRDLNALLAVGHLHLASLGLTRGWMTADAVFGEATVASLSALPDYALLSDSLTQTLSSAPFLPATFVDSAALPPASNALAPRASTSSRLLAFTLRSVFDEYRWQLLLLPHLRRAQAASASAQAPSSTAPALLQRWVQQLTRLRGTLDTAHRLVTGCPIGPQVALLRGLPATAEASKLQLPGWFEPEEPAVSALPLLFSLQQDAVLLQQALAALQREIAPQLVAATNASVAVTGGSGGSGGNRKTKAAADKKGSRAAAPAAPAEKSGGDSSSRAQAGRARVAAAVSACSQPLSARLVACHRGHSLHPRQRQPGGEGSDPDAATATSLDAGSAVTLQSCIAAALHADMTCALLAVGTATSGLCSGKAPPCACLASRNSTAPEDTEALPPLWPTIALPPLLPVDAHEGAAGSGWAEAVDCREGVALVAAAGAASWSARAATPAHA